jgi:hypothetical protein
MHYSLSRPGTEVSMCVQVDLTDLVSKNRAAAPYSEIEDKEQIKKCRKETRAFPHVHFQVNVCLLLFCTIPQAFTPTMAIIQY